MKNFEKFKNFVFITVLKLVPELLKNTLYFYVLERPEKLVVFDSAVLKTLL
jgi:hypothetical protein